MKTKISRREQNILIAGGTLIFLLLFAVYLLQPLWEKNEADQATLVELEKKIETLKAEREKKLKEKPETVESLKNQIRTLRSQLPVTKETAGFANFIVEAADEAGLELIELSVDGDEIKDESTDESDENSEGASDSEDKKKDNSSEKAKDKSNKKSENHSESVIVKGTNILPVTVKVKGSYSQLREFITSLENLKRLNHIKSVVFARHETGMLLCEISLDVYSWAKGDPTLNETDTIPKSNQPGKADPYDSVSYSVYKDIGF